jgi:hypothetical protein
MVRLASNKAAGGSRHHFRVERELARDPKDKSRPFTRSASALAMFHHLRDSPSGKVPSIALK